MVEQAKPSAVKVEICTQKTDGMLLLVGPDGPSSDMVSPWRSALNLLGVLWLFPAAVGAAAVGFLCWGAWRGGYDPGWLASEHGYWAAVLRPDQSWALL